MGPCHACLRCLLHSLCVVCAGFMLRPMKLTNAMPSLVLPRGVQAWMTTRTGGCSAPPWSGLNLGDHVGDDPACVQANRLQLAAQWGARPVFMRQVHGTQVVALGPHGPADGVQADACFSFERGVACTVMVADCLPVLMWDVQGRWVAAAHAGWRGLAGVPGGIQGGKPGPYLTAGEGVLEALWQCLQAHGASAASTQVALGPCIGPQAFEVGQEVRRAFVAADAKAQACFVPSAQAGHWLADLPALAKLRLHRLGLAQVQGNDGSAAWCTVQQTGLFFSHRRDAATLGTTGRMAAGIWRT